MEAQPPPDAPPQPPSEAALLSRRKWAWLVVMGIISVIGCFIWWTRPVILRSHRNPDRTEAVSNARQIGLALFEFETEYGKFPDETTIEKVRQSTGTKMKLGNSSANDFFRQLIASGIAGDEHMFHAKIPGARKPDGNFEGNRALEKGEVGFSYLAGLDTAGNPGRPILVTPLIPGTDRFDRTLFDGMAVILKLNGGTDSIIIDSSGHALLGGRNVLDPAHPVWGGNPPRLVWPE